MAKTPDGDGTVAGSFAGSLRQQHGELQSARPLRRAARADRRTERETQRRASSGVSDARRSRPGNLLLSVLDMFDIHQDSIGDSTGRLERSARGTHNRTESHLLAAVDASALAAARSGVADACHARRQRARCRSCWAARGCERSAGRMVRRRCTGRCSDPTKSWLDLLLRAGANAKAANREGRRRCGWRASTEMPPIIAALLERRSRSQREAPLGRISSHGSVAHRQPGCDHGACWITART